MVVSLGSPSRCAVMLGFDIEANNASVKKPILLSSSLLINGYGSLISAGFSTNGKEYIAIISQENYDIKSAIFYIGDAPVLISEKVFTIKNRDFIDLYGVKSIKQNERSREGLLVPFKSGDSLLLKLVSDNIYLTNINGSDRETEPDFSKNNFQNKATVNKKSTRLIDRLGYEANPMERPQAAEIEIESSKIIKEELIDLTSLPVGQKEPSHGFKNNTMLSKKYSNLSPTLGDFLETIKSESSNEVDNNNDIYVIPTANEDMELSLIHI